MKCTRRQLLVGFFGLTAGTSALVGWGLGGSKPAPAAPKNQLPLAIEQQNALLAALERIFPGAVEAGVPDYMAYWLTKNNFFAGQLAEIETGLILLDRVALRLHKRAFRECAPEQQDEVLRQFQTGAVKQNNFNGARFFERLVTLTLEGFFSDPKYGGNRHQVGWKLVGYKPCWWAPREMHNHP